MIGGLGFIGSNLVARLVRDGAAVTVVTPVRARHAETAAVFESSGVRIVEADMANAPAMAAAVDRQDLVFHVAGRSGAVASMDDPIADLDGNCRGTLVVLEALRALNRRAKLVFVGSRLEYGRAGSAPVDEDHPLDPLCVYAVHKLAIEKYLRLYSQLFGMRYVVARVTNPYGPGQPSERTAYGVVNRMIHVALGDGPLTIYGDGRQQRDYIYVDDVSAALVALAGSAAVEGRAYNVGTGVGTAMIDMARTITAVAGGGRIERVDWPPLAAQVETGDFVADVTRITRDTSWRPAVALDEGVRRTVAFCRAQVCR